jgi:hypothetical protein
MLVHPPGRPHLVDDEDFSFLGGTHSGVKRLVGQPSTSSEARCSVRRGDDHNVPASPA